MKETKKYFSERRIRSEQWGGWHQINFMKGMVSLSKTAFYHSRGKTYIYMGFRGFTKEWERSQTVGDVSYP